MRGLMVFLVATNAFYVGLGVGHGSPFEVIVLNAIAMLCCGIAAWTSK